jgi:hypothetical protein
MNDRPPDTLLVCPTFFGYDQCIQAALERRGHSVVLWGDRASNSALHKLLLRLFPVMVARWSEEHFARRLRALDCSAVDTVLVVKGEALSPTTIRSLRAAMPNAMIHLYLWDGIENAQHAVRIGRFFDTISTFDPCDAYARGWRHRPLFVRSVPLDESDQGSRDHDWVFIGTIHSDRYRVLRRFVARNPSLRGFAHGYLPGRMMWWARHLTDWSMWRSGSIRLSTSALPLADVMRIAACARSVVDVEHPRQRGLTMRTIETLLAGRKLVTTNHHIVSSDLYDPSRVLVVDRQNPVIPATFLDSPVLPLPSRTVRRYTLDGFLDDLLGPSSASIADERTLSPIDGQSPSC